MSSFWNNLSDREKKLLIFLSLVISVYLIYDLVVVKSMDRLEEVNAELAEVEEKEHSLEIELARLKILEEEYKDYSLSQVQARLPENVDIPETILWLERMFSDSSLSQPDIQFSQPEERASNYIELNLSFSGSYDNIHNLVGKIENNERVVSLESLNISGVGENISATMSLNVFAQNIDEE